MGSSNRENENRLIDLNQGGPELDPFAPQVPKEAIFHRKDTPPTLHELDPNWHDHGSQTCRGPAKPNRIDYDEAGDSRLPPMEVRRVETNAAAKVSGDWVSTRWGRALLWILLFGMIAGGGYLVVRLWSIWPGWAILVLFTIILLIDIIRNGLNLSERSPYRMPGRGLWWWRPWI